MDHAAPPLNYEASATPTHLQVGPTLPPEVVQCLKNARFLHLATCEANIPHVSLMNYTYLPSSPYTSSPIIIMTTNPASKKTHNLISNPNVSLLVHDWVSHRPATTGSGRAGSPPPEGRSSLAAMLASLNTQALSSISATINGEARIVERGTEEEKFLRAAHLENNTFGGADGETRLFGGDEETSDGGRGCFIEGEEVRVVVVGLKGGRVADWKGAVRDFSIEEKEGQTAIVNGV